MANWGIANPNAFFEGANAMNSMLQRVAARKAGAALNEGNTAGAVAALNEEGALGPAQELQGNVSENMMRQFKYDQARMNQEMQFAYDTANVLNEIRKGGGDVLSAYDQLTPILKQRGDTDEHIASTRKMIADNPERALSAMMNFTSSHLKKYVLRPGNMLVNEQGNKITSAPFAPQLHVVPAGGQLVSQDPNEVIYENQNPPEEQIPSEAIAQLTAGHITRFTNGQEWTIGEDGNPRRVK